MLFTIRMHFGFTNKSFKFYKSNNMLQRIKLNKDLLT